MRDFIKLIRLPNLIIVAATMYLIRYFVLVPLAGNLLVVMVNPYGEIGPIVLQMTRFDFGLLVFATVVITAGGYVINDYFDVKTDLINRGRVIVGTTIPRRTAMMWHNLFNLMGIIAGFYVAYKIGYFMIGILFVLVSGLLYFYSATYKRQFLLGNIIVAVLVAMVPMLVSLFEIPLLYKYYSPLLVNMPDLNFLLWWTGGFAIFAFLTTLAREIVKDIADFEGDKEYGRRTLPVVIGFKASRMIVVLLAVVTIFLLFLTWYIFLNDLVTMIYLAVTVVIPLIVFIIMIVRAEGYRKVLRTGNLLKIVMVAGILYSVVVKLLLY